MSAVLTDLHLNEDELYDVTGYRQRDKQKKALAELRIKFRSRPADGFPLVVREHYVNQGNESPKFLKRTQPNWGESHG
jgi:hypothetical protein